MQNLSQCYSSSQKLCSGNYTLEVLLESYSNPSHKLADESCCNDRISDYDCQTSICSNLFVFCVRPYGYLPSSGQEVCPDISEVYKTFVIKDDNITFTDKQVFNSIKHISNPLKFSGNVWPVSTLFSASFTMSSYTYQQCLRDKYKSMFECTTGTPLVSISSMTSFRRGVYLNSTAHTPDQRHSEVREVV